MINMLKEKGAMEKCGPGGYLASGCSEQGMPISYHKCITILSSIKDN